MLEVSHRCNRLTAQLHALQFLGKSDETLRLFLQTLEQFCVFDLPAVVQEIVNLRQKHALGIDVGIAITEDSLQLLDRSQRTPNTRRHAGETNRSPLETLRELEHVDKILEHPG